MPSALVPVLVILTKRDAMEFEKFGVALGSKTMRQATLEEKEEAWAKAHDQTNSVVQDYFAQIKSRKFPPAAYMCLQSKYIYSFEWGCVYNKVLCFRNAS